MGNKQNTPDIEFLKDYLQKLRELYRTVEELSEEDFTQTETLPQTSPDEERVARLADQSGFEGNLFRALDADIKWDFQCALRKHHKQINIIPKIITKLEEPEPDRDSLLLTVSDMATLLGRGQSVIREQNNRGELPLPVCITGKIQWSKKEVESWIDAKCPSRETWERQWKGVQNG